MNPTIIPILVSALALVTTVVTAAELQVSKQGNDANDGSLAKPFKTISAAAQVAQPGDVVTVHAGTYRERVSPPRGGESDAKRIICQAEPGEAVMIKGSEVVRDWQPFFGEVWKATVPNTVFGKYHPYKDLINGDWFTDKGRPHQTGEVYLDGKSLYETHLLERVLHPQLVPDSRDHDGSTWTWFCEVDERNTYLYANVHGKNPNEHLVEINVHDACFYPEKPGCDFITVRGFRMAHAATQWAAPTAEQIGLIGTHWSKGWIIEHNVISDSKCSGITLGKDRATGHNVWNADRTKTGATHYNEVIDRALTAGWSREKIGSHIVRHNAGHNEAPLARRAFRTCPTMTQMALRWPLPRTTSALTTAIRHPPPAHSSDSIPTISRSRFGKERILDMKTMNPTNTRIIVSAPALLAGSVAQVSAVPGWHPSYEPVVQSTAGNEETMATQSGSTLQGGVGDPDSRYASTGPLALPPASAGIKLSAWCGERVNAQIVITAGATQANLRVESAVLRNGASAMPVQANFVRYTLGNVTGDEWKNTGGVQTNFAKVQPLGDILDTETRLTAAAGANRPIWLTVDVPANAAPGNYVGTVTVRTDSGTLAFPIALEVLAATLPAPKEWKFHLDLWQQPEAVARYHRVPLWSPEHFSLLKPLMQRGVGKQDQP